MRTALSLRARLIAAVLMLASLALAPAAAQAAPQANHDQGFTVFYVNKNYTGFAAHAYENQSYGDLGTLANQASSLISHSDWQTCVWKGRNFTGESRCYAPGQAVADLGTFDNQIESIRLTPAPKTVDLKDYFLTDGSKRNIMRQGGERFYTFARTMTRAKVRSPQYAFTIVKNTDGNVYEEFTYDSSYIYHLRDTSWAAQVNGQWVNVKCQGTQDDAMFTLKYNGLEGAPWVPRMMTVGQTSAKLAREVIGINKNPLVCAVCAAPYTGTSDHTIKLVSQGPVSWRTDATTFSHQDVIRLAVVDGVGKGDNFWYARGLGWIGFQKLDPPEKAIAAEGPNQRIVSTEAVRTPFREICPNCTIP